MLAEVITEYGSYKKKYPIVDNSLEIRPPRTGPGGTAYRVEFDRNCIIPFETGIWPFKSKKEKVMFAMGASKCINFGKGAIQVAMWDKTSEEELFKANVIKAAGATTTKTQIPMLLYLLIATVIMLQVIGILMSTGRLRFI